VKPFLKSKIQKGFIDQVLLEDEA
jgi:hypothetical protein